MMKRVLTTVASGLLSIGSVAVLGPKLGLFVWTGDPTSEQAPAPEPTVEVTEELSPPTAARQTGKPEWVDRSIAALESDVARFQQELATVEEEAARNSSALQRAQQEMRKLRTQPKKRPPPAIPTRRPKMPSGPQLSVSDCRISGSSFSGQATFQFTVRNAGQRIADVRAAIYLIEHDYMLGPQRSLVAEVPIEVPSRGSVEFSRTWTLTDPGLSASCEVKLRQ